VEGIRQGLDDMAHGRTRPAKEDLACMKAICTLTPSTY
jgi:hypothetical protein